MHTHASLMFTAVGGAIWEGMVKQINRLKREAPPAPPAAPAEEVVLLREIRDQLKRA